MCPLKLDFTLNQMCPLETMNFNQMWPFSHNIILHGSHSHNLYWIYALLSRNQPCRDYALWEALFGQNLVGGGTKTFYWTGTLITCFYFQIAWFLLKLVVGPLGECSGDLHELLNTLAESKMQYLCRSRGQLESEW